MTRNKIKNTNQNERDNRLFVSIKKKQKLVDNAVILDTTITCIHFWFKPT